MTGEPEAQRRVTAFKQQVYCMLSALTATHLTDCLQVLVLVPGTQSLSNQFWAACALVHLVNLGSTVITGSPHFWQ